MCHPDHYRIIFRNPSRFLENPQDKNVLNDFAVEYSWEFSRQQCLEISWEFKRHLSLRSLQNHLQKCLDTRFVIQIITESQDISLMILLLTKWNDAHIPVLTHRLSREVHLTFLHHTVDFIGWQISHKSSTNQPEFLKILLEIFSRIPRNSVMIWLLTKSYTNFLSFSTAYCIWSAISSFLNLNWESSSLGLFCHVPL